MLINTQVLTTKEAAEYLKLNPQVLEKYLRAGEIPARKVGRQWRISQLALDLWLAPSLASVLPRLLLWQEIFALGDKIDGKTPLTDEEILKEVEFLRKKRGLSFESRP